MGEYMNVAVQRLERLCREDATASSLLRRSAIDAERKSDIMCGSKKYQWMATLPLICLSEKPGEAVNGGQSPFILTVDWLGQIGY
ncbi:MAG: hypothetical protein Q4E13_00955 [Clostridia bacterium]|nr:hypothetical protein [Clostridia bacterium]